MHHNQWSFPPEHTHCRRKVPCTAGSLFHWFALNSFSTYKKSKYVRLRLIPIQLNWRSSIQRSFPYGECFLDRSFTDGVQKIRQNGCGIVGTVVVDRSVVQTLSIAYRTKNIESGNGPLVKTNTKEFAPRDTESIQGNLRSS